MKILESKTDGENRKIGIVASRFNDFITTKLLEGAKSRLMQRGVSESNITVAWVPGSFELPFAAFQLAKTGKFDAVICLGALIRGETTHFDFIAAAAANGIEQASRQSGVPVLFGVLTCENVEQAMERVGGKAGHKGEEAAMAALEMANLNGQLK